MTTEPRPLRTEPTSDKILFVAVGALELAASGFKPTPRCTWCDAWIVDGPPLWEGSQPFCGADCYHDFAAEHRADERADRDFGYSDEVPF